MQTKSNTNVRTPLVPVGLYPAAKQANYHISKAQTKKLVAAYNAGGTLATPHIARANWAIDPMLTLVAHTKPMPNHKAPTSVQALGQSMAQWGKNPLIKGPTYKIRQPLAQNGVTLQAAKTHVANLQLTQQQLASGQWVKLSVLHLACKAANIPISTMVYAIGQDRAYYPTLALPQGTKASSAGTLSHFTCLYSGRTRYVPSSALTAGLQQLAQLCAQGGSKAVQAQCTVPPGQ